MDWPRGRYIFGTVFFLYLIRESFRWRRFVELDLGLFSIIFCFCFCFTSDVAILSFSYFSSLQPFFLLFVERVGALMVDHKASRNMSSDGTGKREWWEFRVFIFSGFRSNIFFAEILTILARAIAQISILTMTTNPLSRFCFDQLIKHVAISSLATSM